MTKAQAEAIASELVSKGQVGIDETPWPQSKSHDKPTLERKVAKAYYAGGVKALIEALAREGAFTE